MIIFQCPIAKSRYHRRVPAPLCNLRDNALVAHVAPLMVFVLFTALPGFFRIENAALPWYQRGPEHWVYPVQTLACGALLLWWWRNYTLAPWRSLGVAFMFGVIGITVWIAPGIVLHWNRDHEMAWPDAADLGPRHQ